MAVKFYQFDYAEMENHNIKSLGILYFETEKPVTKEVLKDYAREYLHKPAANILISNVIRLSRKDFERVKPK